MDTFAESWKGLSGAVNPFTRTSLLKDVDHSEGPFNIQHWIPMNYLHRICTHSNLDCGCIGIGDRTLYRVVFPIHPSG